MITIQHIIFPYTQRIIHIGDSDYEDYTSHKDNTRKANYIARHFPSSTSKKGSEDWENPLTAGFWSRWLLWNKKTLDESIKDIRKRFNISITTY